MAATIVVLGLSGPLAAQQASGQDNPTHVVQTESASANADSIHSRLDQTINSDRLGNAGSPVYHPQDINVEAAAVARERRLAQDQVSPQPSPDNGTSLPQLSGSDDMRALAQLTPGERRVLLDAVEGTDICERDPDIPAIRALCDGRIETRSAEFAQDSEQRLSAEERLLGEGLDGDRAADLQSAISQLARNSPRADDFSNQIIASVGQPGAANPGSQPPSGDQGGVDQLSAETQALINAIVNEFGGNSGGR